MLRQSRISSEPSVFSLDEISDQHSYIYSVVNYNILRVFSMKSRVCVLVIC